jgi:hypothetical protein
MQSRASPRCSIRARPKGPQDLRARERREELARDLQGARRSDARGEGLAASTVHNALARSETGHHGTEQQPLLHALHTALSSAFALLRDQQVAQFAGPLAPPAPASPDPKSIQESLGHARWSLQGSTEFSSCPLIICWGVDRRARSPVLPRPEQRPSKPPGCWSRRCRRRHIRGTSATDAFRREAEPGQAYGDPCLDTETLALTRRPLP